MNKKFDIQNSEYTFPYHHLASLENQSVSRGKILGGGIEYLIYMKNIADRVKEIKPKNIIDIGCGDGKFFTFFQVDEIEKMVGCDLVEKALSFAKSFTPNAEWINKDIGEISEKFECAVCIEVIEHIPDEAVIDFLKKSLNLLEKGGTLFIQVPTIVLPLIDKHYRHYTFKELKSQLTSTGIKHDITSVNYVFKKNIIDYWYNRLTYNKYWKLEVKKIDQLFYKYAISKLKNAKEKNGKHLLVEIKKI